MTTVPTGFSADPPDGNQGLMAGSLTTEPFISFVLAFKPDQTFLPFLEQVIPRLAGNQQAFTALVIDEVHLRA